jgi:transcription antitermination factor NusG
MSPEQFCGWLALQTRAGHERMVASILEEKWYEVFLPLIETHRKWSDRVKTIVTPLFPGYVFCRTTSDAVGRIVSTNGVCRIVGFGKVPALVDDKEIESIRRIIASGVPACPCQYLHAGQRVTIAAGPLAGLEGIVVRSGGHHQLVVSVELLRRAVAVQLDASWVRADEVAVV